jgi:hypothetical protein
MTDLLRVMDAGEARRLTERIRLTATTFAESREKLMALVTEAKDGNAHIALGYASWTDYLSDVLGEEPLRLARDDRRELVSALAAEGMSTRAIAPIVGASHQTVANDLESPVKNLTPGPRVVTGMDGKTYTPPKQPSRKHVSRVLVDGKWEQQIVDVESGEITITPSPEPSPRATARKPLTDQFFDAAYDLSKVTERLERLASDDRFPQNADKVAAKHRSDLVRAIDALQGVVNRLPSA